MRAKVELVWEEPAMPLGELTTVERRTYFQASREWLANPLPIDPAGPPEATPVEVPRGHKDVPLLGMLGDSIPDGWGLKVLHTRARRLGLSPEALRPEELLCLVGNRGSGALTYAPATDAGDPNGQADLEALYREALAVEAGESSEVIDVLGRAVGGSGGARPKVSIDLIQDGRVVAHGGRRPAGARTFLVKFPARQDGADFGAVELAYAAIARASGITIPATRAFEVGGGTLRCFGVERFDRPVGEPRPHVLSLAAVLRADFRRDLTTYETYLAVVFQLTADRDQVLQAYRRMIFNVLASVRDDHMKNFGFLLPRYGEWGLAPAFDLVPSLEQEHVSTIDGRGLAVSRGAARRAIGQVLDESVATLARIEEEVADGVAGWLDAAKEWGVEPARARRVEAALNAAKQDFDAPD